MNTELLKSIVGGEVYKSSAGHGSFIEIGIKRLDGSTLDIWVYLADWALLKREVEIISSDSIPSDFQTFKEVLFELAGKMVKYAAVINKYEIHIGFTGHYELEIWANETAYGYNSVILRLFSNNEHISDIENFES